MHDSRSSMSSRPAIAPHAPHAARAAGEWEGRSVLAQARALATACTLACAALALPGRPAAAAVDFGAGVATTYDDNYLDYSNRDLFQFQYRLNPTRYGVKTTDDLVIASYVDATWMPESTHSSLAARLETNKYATNDVRDNLKASVQWRAHLSPRWRWTLSGAYLPRYYVRRYVDYDLRTPYPSLSRYRDAQYRQADAAVSAEWRPSGGWRDQLGYTFSRRDFLEAFPERDQSRHQVRLVVRPPHHGPVAARLHGSTGWELARGPQGLPGNGAPDVSTQSLGAGLLLDWTPTLRGHAASLRQAVNYETRRYTTPDAGDTGRFGRSVHQFDVGWQLALKFSKHWEAVAAYDLVRERLTGPLSNVANFTDAGTYHRNRVTAGISWASRGAGEQ